MKYSEFKTKDTSDISQQEKSGDHASSPNLYRLSTGFGIMMVIASFILMIADFPFAFDVTSLAWGSILIGLGQYFGYKEHISKLAIREKQLELEHLRERQAYQLLITEKILPHLPESIDSLNVIKNILREDFEKLNLPDNQEPPLRIKNELKNKT